MTLPWRFIRRSWIDNVTFYRHHFMDESDLAWLERFSDLALRTEEQKALVYARKTGHVDNAAFRRLNHTDPRPQVGR